MSRDWWKYYIDGKMVRRDDTPLSIIRTLEDWSDASLADEKDSMWQFVKGKPVDPRKLQRAIDDCISSNTIAGERQKLKDLQVWVIRESALAESAKSLREAREAFGVAAQTAGLDSYTACVIRDAAL